MIWKIVVVLSVALSVQGEEDAISEQRVVIHHQKSFRDGSLSHIRPNKSGNQDEYARAYPSYEFSYKVNDPKTHDMKGQHETREGDEVIGNYWLIEPNGRKRTVNYQANDDSGFNAQIEYTASRKKEETDGDVSVSQGKNTEEENIEENNNEGIEISVGEEIQEVQDSNDESENNKEPAPVEENNLSEQIESDSQKYEANNINNVDRNDEGKVSQIQIVENKSYLENIEPNLSKSRRGNNNTEKGKRENSKRHSNHDQVRYGNESNKNNRVRPNNNNKRGKHDDLKNISNKNRNSHKENQMNRDKNVHNQESVNNDGSYFNVKKGQIDTDQEPNQRNQYGFIKGENNNNNGESTNRNSNFNVKKGQIDTDQEPNQRNQYGFIKGENNNNNEESTNRNSNKNYDYTNFAPSDEVHRKIDSYDSEDTFEHRIRIYHPKNISPTSKGKH